MCVCVCVCVCACADACADADTECQSPCLAEGVRKSACTVCTDAVLITQSDSSQTPRTMAAVWYKLLKMNFRELTDQFY